MPDLVKATVLVKGRVYHVGYRGRIKEIARQMGLTGSVKNIDDYENVLVTVEGDREKVGQFLREIEIHEQIINVESIETEFSEYLGEFKIFKIIRGTLEEEMCEGLDAIIAIHYSQDSKRDPLNE